MLDEDLRKRIEILCEKMSREYDVNEYFRALEELGLKHLYSDDDMFYIMDISSQRIIMIDSDFRDYRITSYRVSNEFIKLLDNIEITNISFFDDENNREYMQIDYV